jgi:hypothetical protein
MKKGWIKAMVFFLPFIFIQSVSAATIVFQDGLNGYTGTQDTFIMYNSENNFGIRNIIYLKELSGAGYTDRTANALFSFDISAIPANMHITSATLSLYKALETVDPIGSLYKITSGPWVEGNANGSPLNGAPDWFDRAHGTAPWNIPGLGAGTDYDPTPSDSVALAAPGWYDWDTTSIVDDWYTGTSANYGFVLKASGQSLYQIFVSSEFNSSYEYLRPKLTVTYEPATLSLLGAGLLGLLGLRKKAKV